ncbi:hypothetical protein [Streptomyces sp. NPDC016626]|uniref:hypothetical protein n=1 Tax=Streptomyces sp. NPDC016626 TaxID=3364968 RepID=UPI0036FD5631
MACIRVLQAVAGLHCSWQAGDLVDLPDDEAAKWADGVRAELADQTPAAPAGSSPAPPADDPPPSAGPAPADDPGAGDDPDGTPAPDQFDPAAHSVKGVIAYLNGVGEEEAMRVLKLEATAEQPRRGIVGQRGSILERAQANDLAAAERAAVISRGGGRGPAVETR